MSQCSVIGLGLSCCAIAAGACLTMPVIGEPTLTEVYVYNGGADNQGRKGDGFSNTAVGWCWSKLGWVGGEGQGYIIAEVNPRDRTKLMLGDTQVGHVITSGEQVIGFDTMDHSKGVRNLDTSAKFSDVWAAVTNTGNLVIAKHGETVSDEGQVIHTLLTLDGGKTYAGVKAQGTKGGGTGPDGYDPYALAPREKATIKVTVHACFSSLDPPGAGRSVTDTFKDVPGVSDAAVTGHTAGATAGVVLKYTVPNGTAERMKKVLEECARGNASSYTKLQGADLLKAGDTKTWYFLTEFPRKRDAVVKCLQKAKFAFSRVGFVYSMSEAAATAAPEGDVNGEVEVPGYYLPMHSVGPEGAVLKYEPELLPDAAAMEGLELQIPPGALAAFRDLLLHPVCLDALNVTLPCGTMPATLAGVVEDHDGDPLSFSEPALLTLSNHCRDEVIGVYQIVGSSLVPVDGADHQVLEDRVILRVHQTGVFIALTTRVIADRADVAGDQTVDGIDLAVLLAAWGGAGDSDLDCSGVVDSTDLAHLIASWGPVPAHLCKSAAGRN